MKPIMVDFITSLNVEKVPKLSSADYIQYITRGGKPDDASRVTASDAVLLTERYYTHIVPVNQICFSDGRPDTYVAYSEEVERLIGVPVRVIKKQAEAAEDNAQVARRAAFLAEEEADRWRLEYYKIYNWGFWQRLRFAFTGRGY